MNQEKIYVETAYGQSFLHPKSMQGRLYELEPKVKLGEENHRINYQRFPRLPAYKKSEGRLDPTLFQIERDPEANHSKNSKNPSAAGDESTPIIKVNLSTENPFLTDLFIKPRRNPETNPRPQHGSPEEFLQRKTELSSPCEPDFTFRLSGNFRQQKEDQWTLEKLGHFSANALAKRIPIDSSLQRFLVKEKMLDKNDLLLLDHPEITQILKARLTDRWDKLATEIKSSRLPIESIHSLSSLDPQMHETQGLSHHEVIPDFVSE